MESRNGSFVQCYFVICSNMVNKIRKITAIKYLFSTISGCPRGDPARGIPVEPQGRSATAASPAFWNAARPFTASWSIMSTYRGGGAPQNNSARVPDDTFFPQLGIDSTTVREMEKQWDRLFLKLVFLR